jgi:DNA primase catalytic subunit
MDFHTQALRDETATLNAQAKALRAELAQLNSILSTVDLRAQVAAMQAEKADIEERLRGLRSGTVKLASKDEKARVDVELRKMEKCVVVRKKIVKEMWGMIAEAVPREEKDNLKEDFGLEL